MKLTSFASRRLPGEYDRRLRQELAEQHDVQPFSPVDTRAAARRVVALGSHLGLDTHIFRGGLDLRGTEVDHVWVSVDGVVVDAAFPLLDAAFVDVLRRFVAGDAEAEDLAHAAENCAITQRVIGEFPRSLRYLGQPIWIDRDLHAGS